MNQCPLNIAIVAGGDSGEHEISIQSGNNILKNLDPALYNARVVVISQKGWEVHDLDGSVYPINRNDFTWKPNGQVKKFDVVVNSIHGTPGENGLLTAYFEMIGIPYTGCRSFTGALTFNKYYCNKYLKQCGIRVAQSMLVRKGQSIDINHIVETIGLPCFIKPNCGGSSCGTTKVDHSGEILPALERALREDREAIIETLLVGTEVTCGLMKTAEKSVVFPITEIVSKKEFFDYEAKYTPGMSEEITPARVSEDTARSVQDLSSSIYDLLDCRGVVRMDYILVDKIPWFLEVNTIPGMSPHSIVPKQASIAGLSLNELFSILIQDAMQQ